MGLCYRLWTQGGATRASISAPLILAARLVVAEGAIFVPSSDITLQFLKNICLSKKNDKILLLYARHLLSWKVLQSSNTYSRRWPQEFSSNHLISLARAAFGKDPVVYLTSPAMACPTTGAISDRLTPRQITAGAWPMGTDKIQAKYTTKWMAAESALGPVLQQPSPATLLPLGAGSYAHYLLFRLQNMKAWGLALYKRIPSA